MLDESALEGLLVSGQTPADEYDEAVLRILSALDELDVEGVSNITEMGSRATIDFSLGKASDISVLQRAKGGRFGSSVVVDTATDMVTSATLRYGSLGLPEGGDMFLATVEIAKRVDQANPPVTGFDPAEADDDLVVRFRDMAGMSMGRLVNEGDDILHIVYNTSVPVEDFAEWLVRFTNLYEEERDEVREFVLEVGHNR